MRPAERQRAPTTKKGYTFSFAAERRVVLLHCLEDRLCVWRPDTLTDLSYNIVLIDGYPAWSGRARHAYGHLLFTPIEEGTHHIDYLQITTPEVIPHGIRCEGLLRVLSWVSFDLPDHCKRTLSALLQAAGNGCSDLHTVPFDGRDIRDDPLATELDLRQELIDMIPIPVKAHAEGGYGNLKPYGSTLWVRVKRHVIHHWLYSLCTEDTWKATTRVHRVMEDW